MRILGILLIVLGIFMLVSGGFNYRTKEKVIETDAIEINKTENKTVTWPWYAGGIAVIGGIIVLLMDQKGRRK